MDSGEVLTCWLLVAETRTRGVTCHVALHSAFAAAERGGTGSPVVAKTVPLQSGVIPVGFLDVERSAGGRAPVVVTQRIRYVAPRFHLTNALQAVVWDRLFLVYATHRRRTSLNGNESQSCKQY